MKRNKIVLFMLAVVMAFCIFPGAGTWAADDDGSPKIVAKVAESSYQQGDNVTVDIIAYDLDYTAVSFMLSFPQEKLQLTYTNRRALSNATFYDEVDNPGGMYIAQTASSFDNAAGRFAFLFYVAKDSESPQITTATASDGITFGYVPKSSEGRIICTVNFTAKSDITFAEGEFEFLNEPSYSSGAQGGNILVKYANDIVSVKNEIDVTTSQQQETEEVRLTFIDKINRCSYSAYSVGIVVKNAKGEVQTGQDTGSKYQGAYYYKLDLLPGEYTYTTSWEYSPAVPQSGSFTVIESDDEYQNFKFEMERKILAVKLGDLTAGLIDGDAADYYEIEKIICIDYTAKEGFFTGDYFDTNFNGNAFESNPDTNKYDLKLQYKEVLPDEDGVCYVTAGSMFAIKLKKTSDHDLKLAQTRSVTVYSHRWGQNGGTPGVLADIVSVYGSINEGFSYDDYQEYINAMRDYGLITNPQDTGDCLSFFSYNPTSTTSYNRLSHFFSYHHLDDFMSPYVKINLTATNPGSVSGSFISDQSLCESMAIKYNDKIVNTNSLIYSYSGAFPLNTEVSVEVKAIDGRTVTLNNAEYIASEYNGTWSTKEDGTFVLKFTTPSDAGRSFNIVFSIEQEAASVGRVYFNSMGGTFVESAQYPFKTKLMKPADPAYGSGNEFLGWFTDEGCTDAWDFENDVFDIENNGMTLYAKWQKPFSGGSYASWYHATWLPQYVDGTYELEDLSGTLYYGQIATLRVLPADGLVLDEIYINNKLFTDYTLSGEYVYILFTPDMDSGYGVSVCMVMRERNESDPPSHGALVSAIKDAQDNIDSVKIAENADKIYKGNNWVMPGEYDAYNRVILAAKAANSGPASEAELKNAIDALKAATDTFNAAKKDGSKALNKANLKKYLKLAKDELESTVQSRFFGCEVQPDQYWVSQFSYYSLHMSYTDALAAADSADQTTVNRTLLRLVGAYEDFITEKQKGLAKEDTYRLSINSRYDITIEYEGFKQTLQYGIVNVPYGKEIKITAHHGENEKTHISATGSYDFTEDANRSIEFKNISTGEGQSVAILRNTNHMVYLISIGTDVMQIPTTANITFNSNGGSNVDPYQNIPFGKIDKPDDPYYKGRIFLGWYKGLTGTELWDFDKDEVDKVNSDVTLYAKWAYIGDVNISSSVSEAPRGGSVTIIPFVESINGADGTLAWSSSYDKVTVENGIVVIAKDAQVGKTVTINAASVLDPSKTDSITFTITENPDIAAAEATEAKISAIGKVEYTAASKAKIDEARSAYNALTDAQQSYVTNLSVLTAAEAEYRLLKQDADDKAAAADTDTKINGIGTVTLESKAKIDLARSAYEALTPSQKAFVTKLSVLEAAETAYAELKAQADKEEADKAAAKGVTDMINAIGTVTLDSKSAIEDARSVYNALTADQKQIITNEQLKILTDAETECEQLYQNITAFENSISALPKTLTKNDMIPLVIAEEQYEALTSEEKTHVGSGASERFESAKKEARSINQSNSYVSIDGLDWKIIIHAVPVESGSDYDDMRANGTNSSLIGMYHIELTQITTDGEFAYQPEGKLMVKILVSNISSYKNIRLLGPSEDGAYDTISHKLEKSYIVFNTDTFGYFGAFGTLSSPQTGDNSSFILSLIAALIAGGGIFFYSAQKKRLKKI